MTGDAVLKELNMEEKRNMDIDVFIAENEDNLKRDMARLVAVNSVESAAEPDAPFGRGAKQALFVDNSKKSAETVRRNLKTTRLDENAKVFRTDYRSFLSVNAVAVDIAFLDPPYRTGALQEALSLVPAHMNDTGVIIAENPLDEEISSEYGDFVLDRQYRYGKIKISTFRHKDFLS